MRLPRRRATRAGRLASSHGADPNRWATVERLYHAALTRPADERAAFLAGACAGDEELRREIESLLAQSASADAVLTRGAAVAAAGLVSDVGRSVLTGRRLGAYQILAPLGAGGMGEVYRARDTRLGRDVAIKILPRMFTSDPERLARFEREARMLAALNHPHIGAFTVSRKPTVFLRSLGAGRWSNARRSPAARADARR